MRRSALLRAHRSDPGPLHHSGCARLRCFREHCLIGGRNRTSVQHSRPQVTRANNCATLENFKYALYFLSIYELIVFCGALIGSGIGFLWYNTYPAEVFMGDIGSLTLGAILGILAVILRHELVFAIMAGVFVIETLSVVIQVISFKTRGKRVFLMAPIHHHYELKGWPEPKIIVRFWIMTLVFILLALATLKFR